eukprot:jgi/Botrbrau1/16872/Bobra.150_2s0091.1
MACLVHRPRLEGIPYSNLAVCRPCRIGYGSPYRSIIGPQCVTIPKPITKPKLVYVGRRRAALAADGISPSPIWPPGATPEYPQISKSDEEFREQKVEFVFGSEGIDLMELNDLFERVGFPTRDLDRLEVALQHTHCVVWIRATAGSRYARKGQLLGFARATSDKALTATIWDVAVNPGWQRIGLGRGAVERLTARLLKEGITDICLYAEPGVIALYTKLGFDFPPEGTRGMAFQRKSKAGAALIASAAA